MEPVAQAFLYCRGLEVAYEAQQKRKRDTKLLHRLNLKTGSAFEEVGKVSLPLSLGAHQLSARKLP